MPDHTIQDVLDTQFSDFDTKTRRNTRNIRKLTNKLPPEEIPGYKGTWSESKSYVKGDTITYQNLLFLRIGKSTREGEDSRGLPSGIVHEMIFTADTNRRSHSRIDGSVTSGSDDTTVGENVYNLLWIAWDTSDSGNRKPFLSWNNLSGASATAIRTALLNTHSVYLGNADNIVELPFADSTLTSQGIGWRNGDPRPSTLRDGTSLGLLIAESGQSSSLVQSYINNKLTLGEGWSLYSGSSSIISSSGSTVFSDGVVDSIDQSVNNDQLTTTLGRSGSLSDLTSTVNLPSSGTGDPGPAGADGRGITSIEDDDNDGVATITYTDNSTDDLPLPRGPAGADGQDGADGAPGQDGQDGADGAPGQDGQDGRSANLIFAMGDSLPTVPDSDDFTVVSGDITTYPDGWDENPPDAVQYEVSYTVTDNNGASAMEMFTIEVSLN